MTPEKYNYLCLSNHSLVRLPFILSAKTIGSTFLGTRLFLLFIRSRLIQLHSKHLKFSNSSDADTISPSHHRIVYALFLAMLLSLPAFAKGPMTENTASPAAESKGRDEMKNCRGKPAKTLIDLVRNC